MALSGAITPLVAAVLMPLSSVAILINTIRGVR
jgi:cation transport ATPase